MPKIYLTLSRFYQWSERRESNPHHQLGGLKVYR